MGQNQDNKPISKKPSPQKVVWVVAKGVSITSKKGLLEAGEEVKAAYFGGGKASLDNLIENKTVVKG